MKTTFRRVEDVLQIRFTDAEIVTREELRAGIFVELDTEGLIVGFEIHDATKAIAAGNDLWGVILEGGD